MNKELIDLLDIYQTYKIELNDIQLKARGLLCELEKFKEHVLNA